VAQPLVKSELSPTNGIDEAVTRLERAFARLEAASKRAATDQLSLKADTEKLNLLLCETKEKSAQLKEVATAVIKRLDHTIGKLEATQA